MLGPSRSRARLFSVAASATAADSATAASTTQPSFRFERRPTVVAPSLRLAYLVRPVTRADRGADSRGDWI